ncbi:MAG: peptidylprolyl isomerase [Nanoarchaeota archaeon]
MSEQQPTSESNAARAVAEGDFIHINYTGKIAETGEIFDTTDQAIAKAHDIGGDGHKHYGPASICVGKGQLLPGIDEQIIGKKKGKYTFSIKDVDAFGKKDGKLLKLVPVSIFKKQKINPRVGMDVDIDGNYGVVRTVTGGRVVVDFNHPLASKDLTYDVEVVDFIDKPEEQVKVFLDMIHLHNATIAVTGDEATITIPFGLPAPFAEQLQGQVASATSIKKLTFVNSAPKKDSTDEKKEAA